MLAKSNFLKINAKPHRDKTILVILPLNKSTFKSQLQRKLGALFFFFFPVWIYLFWFVCLYFIVIVI